MVVSASKAMASSLITKLYLTSLALFIWMPAFGFGQNFLSCETPSVDALGYPCHRTESTYQCRTFAVLFTNSYYSSLSNLSFYLGIDRFSVAQINGFPADAEFLQKDQSLLIPIDCKCNASYFYAEITKIAIGGETFYTIAESLEGLTTCKAIKEQNPGIPPSKINDKARIVIPLRCACPSSSNGDREPKILLSYPVREGDMISNLATRFNTTSEAIISANNRYHEAFKSEILLPFSTLLIPLASEPPGLNFPATSNNIEAIEPHKKKPKMWLMGLFIGLGVTAAMVAIAISAFFFVIKKNNNKQLEFKGRDVELQQLSLSVRTTSEKKFSFEASQNNHDAQITISTPKKMVAENYTIEELRKATDEFNSSNQIKGSVYHGRLNGKNLAIKRTRAEIISTTESRVFHHPNIVRMLGKCVREEGLDSYLVFEYAKNGSLKDWLHGGLAMKNQFIASCYCFLTWNQRLKICLDIAVGLQYLHHIMSPPYIHRNIKSKNIFLDEEFKAKIGNTGMASSDEINAENPQSRSNAPSFTRNHSYFAPEYVNQGVISPAIDVFAYGVVLLEVLTSDSPIAAPNEKEGAIICLSEKIKTVMQSENYAEELREWIDGSLGENYSFEAALSVAAIARACVDEDFTQRPTAEEIVEKLSAMVEEIVETEHPSTSESSSKPLVKAVASLPCPQLN